jgi:catechol 2,3-dioxygenase-like lactoylglutathione lyase family enzyme
MRKPLDQILAESQPSTALQPYRTTLGMRLSRQGHIGAGMGVAAAAFFLALASSGGGALAALLLPAILLGFLTLPFFGAAVAMTPPPEPPDGVTAVDRVRADHIRAAMARNGGKPTVEQIAWKLQWSVAAVAAGLRVLLQQREIIEDVDLETGEFMYYLTSAITPENLADDLERRIAQAARSAGLPLDEVTGTPAPELQAHTVQAQQYEPAQMWRR